MILKDAIERLRGQFLFVTGNVKATDKDRAKFEGDCLKLISEFPNEPQMHVMLASYYAQIGKEILAIALIERCMKFGEFGATPWINLGYSWRAMHREDEAVACYKKAVEMAKQYPSLNDKGHNTDLGHAYHGLASVYVNSGEPSKCIYYAERALKADPDDRFAAWNKGLGLLEMGKWKEGFELYDSAGFVHSDVKPMERKLKTYGGLPMWDGTPGQTVITYGEQGIGDEVMLASIIPDLMAKCNVIIDCDPRLESLFRRSFDVEAVYPTSDIDAAYPWIENHKVDAIVPMGSLGKWFRHKDSDFPKKPFLASDAGKVAKWHDFMKRFDGLKVGISWAGGSKKTRFDKRTIPLSQWEPILKTEGCHFFSLQYHKFAMDETAEVGKKLGVPVYHYDDVVMDYDETAAFLKSLDLVITVNTSLHHLTGAVGTEQWCLTPKMCAWRYGVKGPSPWYSHCTMMRQDDSQKWEPVIEKAATQLADMTMRAAA